MDTARGALPDDITALKQALATERAKALDIAAELAVARAKASEDTALIAQQKLRIAKLERQIYGQRSERSSRLIDQLALMFEELEASATEDELAAEKAVARTTTVRGFTRTRPERNTFPDHLPRERVVIDPPVACECCGSSRLRKLGEDVTRTLESVPRQWKVIETVREKFILPLPGQRKADRKRPAKCYCVRFLLIDRGIYTATKAAAIVQRTKSPAQAHSCLRGSGVSPSETSAYYGPPMVRQQDQGVKTGASEIAKALKIGRAVRLSCSNDRAVTL